MVIAWEHVYMIWTNTLNPHVIWSPFENNSVSVNYCGCKRQGPGGHLDNPVSIIQSLHRFLRRVKGDGLQPGGHHQLLSDQVVTFEQSLFGEHVEFLNW